MIRAREHERSSVKVKTESLGNLHLEDSVFHEESYVVL